jgi:hypothetical protein
MFNVQSSSERELRICKIKRIIEEEERPQRHQDTKQHEEYWMMI